MSCSIGKLGIGMAGAIACAGLLSAGCSTAQAGYYQGFETNTNGWLFGGETTTGTGSYSITRYQSGTALSPLGSINAATGNYYAVIGNNENNNGASLGDAGYTIFGAGASTYPGPFTQSISVYVPVVGPTAWGSTGTGYGFEIDETANSVIAANNPNFYTEVDFQFLVSNPGLSNETVNVRASTGGAAGGAGNLPLASITQNGWYTFALTYFRTGNETTDPVGVNFAAYGQSGSLLGSASDKLTGAASNTLGGNNYLWVTNWQSGFAGDNLAIDNVAASTPIPATFGLVGIGSLALIGGMALRRRMAAKL